MAIAAGDEVALSRDFTDPTLAANPNVLFGRVMATDGTESTVQWDTGVQSEGVLNAQLDKINGDSSGIGRNVVTFTDHTAADNASPEYQAVIVRGYTRQLNGSGAAPEFVLARELSTGQLWEALRSVVVDVEGR